MITKKCPKCNGTGQVLDAVEVGAYFKVHRRDSRISLREVAKRLNISAAYCSDLEQGRRRWSLELMERYRKAIYGNWESKPA